MLRPIEIYLPFISGSFRSIESDIMPENEQLIHGKIERHFKFLLDRGFRIRSVKYYPQYMGNWIARLESQECLIDITNDRGEITLSVGPKNEEKELMWFGLKTIVFYLSKGKKLISSYEGELREKDKQFERLVEILVEYIDEIVLIMGKDFGKHRLNLQAAKKQVLGLDVHSSSKRLP